MNQSPLPAYLPDRSKMTSRGYAISRAILRLQFTSIWAVPASSSGGLDSQTISSCDCHQRSGSEVSLIATGADQSVPPELTGLPAVHARWGMRAAPLR